MPISSLAPDPQTLRLRRFYMASGSYAYGSVLIALGVAGGIFSSQVLLAFAGYSVVFTGLFYAAFRSGWNLRASDPSLTAWQMAAAMGGALHVVYLSGPLHGIMLTWLLVIFTFGMLRLSRAVLLKFVVAALLGYGAVLWQLQHEGGADFQLRVSLFQWLLLAGVLVWFALMGGHLSALRAAVKASDRRLVAITHDLQRQTQHLQMAQAAANMLVLDWDIRNDIVVFSDSPVWLRGPVPEGAAHYPLFKDQVHPEDRLEFLAGRQRAIDTLRGSAPEFRVVRTDGQVIWVQSHQTVLAGPDGKAARLIAAICNITERKQSELALLAAKSGAEQANEAKDTFLATMSHELRTPLTGLLGMMELLARSPLPPDQAQTLAIARDSGAAMARIIDDILDHAKMVAGKLSLVPEPLALAPWLAQMLSSHQRLAADKGLTLRRHVDPRIAPILMADPLRLMQVVGNFVSNAIKFTSSGRITVRVEWLQSLGQTQTLRLSVTDTGIGMTAKQQQGLFQPFAQASIDTTRLYGGTGLGLDICRRLADLMGGQIEVESEYGAGTVMSLIVPLEIGELKLAPASCATEATEANDEPTPTPLTLLGRRILAVDDHATNRLLLLRQLNMLDLGLTVTPASDGQDALRRWRTGEFDMVITDCNMPQMDGYELARQLRQIEQRQGSRRSAIIGWTASATPGIAQRCLVAGMDAVLTKPATMEALNATVLRWLSPEAATAPPSPHSSRLS